MLHRNRAWRTLAGVCIALADCAALALGASRDTGAKDDAMAAIGPRFDVAQFRSAPPIHTPTLPPITLPTPLPHITPPNPLPSIRSPDPLPSITTPTPLPPITSPAPPYTASPPPPPPPIMPRILVPPACVVANTDDWLGSRCSNRYIYYSDLVRELAACGDYDARCFADRIIELAEQPIIVVYPQPAAELRAYIQNELSYAIGVMGDHLKDRVLGGAPNLPSISAINNMVDRATRAVDAVNLPVDETQEEQLRRLGLTPDMVGLARAVLNS
jgi:hypothetical protein